MQTSALHCIAIVCPEKKPAVAPAFVHRMMDLTYRHLSGEVAVCHLAAIG